MTTERQIAELHALRIRLKSGEYNGADIMAAWLALNELRGLRQRMATTEPDCWAVMTPNGSRLVSEAEARGLLKAYPLFAAPQPAKPIDMILHCPACGLQHIDAPEVPELTRAGLPADPAAEWTNPPHRSHLCKGCGHIWRPADVPTNGVAAIKTRGNADSKPTPTVARCTACAGSGEDFNEGDVCFICNGTGKAKP